MAATMPMSRFPSSRVVALSNSVPQREFIEDQARHFNCLAVQHHAGQGGTIKCSTVLCNVVLHHILQFNTKQCTTVQYHAVQYSNMKCSLVHAVLCSTVPCSVVQ